MQANQKYSSIMNLIDNYLKSNANEANLEIIRNAIKNIQINDLVKLFVCYSNLKYVSKYDVKTIINIISQEIIAKLEELSLIKVIDLYIMFFNRSLVIEDVLIANKNILSVMSSNILNNDYVESKIKKKNISKEKFIEECKAELDTYVKLSSFNETINTYLEELQENILAYIETQIQSLDGQKKRYFRENLDARFENASKELLNLSECFDNRQKLLRTDATDLLGYNVLKGRIVVYEMFRNKLLANKKDDAN